jgi:hypothetical protein
MQISHGWTQKMSAVLTDRTTPRQVLRILAETMGDGLLGLWRIQKGDCSGKTLKVSNIILQNGSNVKRKYIVMTIPHRNMCTDLSQQSCLMMPKRLLKHYLLRKMFDAMDAFGIVAIFRRRSIAVPHLQRIVLTFLWAFTTAWRTASFWQIYRASCRDFIRGSVVFCLL